MRRVSLPCGSSDSSLPPQTLVESWAKLGLLCEAGEAIGKQAQAGRIAVDGELVAFLGELERQQMASGHWPHYACAGRR
jgi:hypothetical protein